VHASAAPSATAVHHQAHHTIAVWHRNHPTVVWHGRSHRLSRRNHLRTRTRGLTAMRRASNPVPQSTPARRREPVRTNPARLPQLRPVFSNSPTLPSVKEKAPPIVPIGSTRRTEDLAARQHFRGSVASRAPPSPFEHPFGCSFARRLEDPARGTL